MSLLSALLPNGSSGFGYGSTAREVVSGLDLSGRAIVVTGANSGLGLMSVQTLAERGATVLACARSAEKAASVASSVEGDVRPVVCELGDPTSVVAAAETIRGEVPTVDVLLLNAGIMALPRLSLIEGYEAQFFTNHLAHMLLYLELASHLSPTARVVSLSSRAHEMTVRGGIDFSNLDGQRGYFAWTFYGQSKLANLLFVRALQRRLEGTGRIALAVHPGVIETNLGRHMGVAANAFFAVANPIALKNVAQGAATQCWAAVHPDAAGAPGAYLADVNIARPSRWGRDDALAERLWQESVKILDRYHSAPESA